jgi:response regulator RpfG family c-di-GMP phosphodiesterase
MSRPSVYDKASRTYFLPNGEEAPKQGSHALIHDLLSTCLVLVEDWEVLPEAVRQRTLGCSDVDKALALLVQHGLLTNYQAARIKAHTIFGLVLGNYRVLDRIGAGGMAVVFKGEHMHMRQPVAIKVLPLHQDEGSALQTRFFSEMRTVAKLHHPNIVTATDAGKIASPHHDQPGLLYLVMEYVAGQDLEEYVATRGPLVPAKACNLAHQVACALAETHKFQMVHRDIKPSNVMVTVEDVAKLLDFGLARNFDTRLTQPGAVLGTLDFMAPEQAQDASTVDIRADLYGLGGTLFWCLTGQLPFPTGNSVAHSILKRLTQPPPSVRDHLPDLPMELDVVVQRMMAVKPEDRYATPQEVMRALLPFIKPESRTNLMVTSRAEPAAAGDCTLPEGLDTVAKTHRVLVADDEEGIRDFCSLVLRADGLECIGVHDGLTALEAASTSPYDLVLLDVNMPGLTGVDVLKYLRETPPSPHLKVIMFSGQSSPDEMAEMLLAGADDYLTKPFSVIQLQGRVKAGLRLKDAQDRSASLNRQLLALNAELENNLTSLDGTMINTRNGLVLALARLVEHRERQTGGQHLRRMQRYCRCLAEHAAGEAPFSGEISQYFIDSLVCCAPLHDIGKIGLPDHLLLKGGQLSLDERILMQAHTLMGADFLTQTAEQIGVAVAFLQMAIDIARHHHERYDGTGYPDRLAGSTIPLAARIASICDVYDALRSRRPFRPALSHHAAMQMMTEASPGQFDPALLQVFRKCTPEFERVFKELVD